MDVTLYHPAGPCPKCNATKLHLKKEGVSFHTILADDDTIARFQADGHQSFPIVVVNHADGAKYVWSDYRRDEIKRLASLLT